MNLTIRKATLDDLKDIQELNAMLFQKENKEYDNNLNINWPYEDGEQYFTKQIENHFLYVAIDRNIVIGYLSGTIKKTNLAFNRSRAVLDNMVISENYRDQGIGTLLVEKFKLWCIKNNVKEILVDVFEANTKGINFYKNNGFDNYEVLLKCNLD